MVEKRSFSLKDYEDMYKEQLALKEASERCVEKIQKKNFGWTEEQISEYVELSKKYIEKNEALIKMCMENIEKLKNTR